MIADPFETIHMAIRSSNYLVRVRWELYMPMRLVGMKIQIPMYGHIIINFFKMKLSSVYNNKLFV